LLFSFSLDFLAVLICHLLRVTGSVSTDCFALYIFSHPPSPFAAPSSAEEDEFYDQEWGVDLDESFFADHTAEVSHSVHNFECSFREVKIDFPYRPYDSQNQMMEKIITGVQTETNCLLESPTGTGKTAALLCSLLAWQKEYEILQQSFREGSFCSCGFDVPGASIIPIQHAVTKEWELQRAPFITPFSLSSPQNSTVPMCSSNTATSCNGSSPKKTGIEMPALVRTLSEVCESCNTKYVSKGALASPEKEKVPLVPIIYYATRTHSQVDQVVKQLKQTAYSEIPMTILSSRNITCINEEVKENSKAVPVDDECEIMRHNFNTRKMGKELQPNEKICEFYQGGDLLLPYSAEFRSKTFDIEDLLKFGKRAGLCPYYGSKKLLLNAKIVFCPYNYILYPWIRKASEIEIEDNIIVFDEAHNIEQICRDVSSIEMTEETLQNRIYVGIGSMREKLQDAVKVVNKQMHERLERLMQDYSVHFQQILKWIKTQAHEITLQPQDSEQYRQLSLDDVIMAFSEMGFREDSLIHHEENVRFMRDPETAPKIPNHIISFIDSVLYTLSLLYRQGNKRIPDFSAIVTKRRIDEDTFTTGFTLRCNNPALAFRKFKSARTVIVASGTLSPIISFESELGVKFEQKLMARHVIHRDQIWTGSLSAAVSIGNHLTPLSLHKYNQNRPEIQDFLGERILRICQIVPCGVVVFLPSYTLLNALRARWESYPHEFPLLPRLGTLKSIFLEESGQNSTEFKQQMADYKRKVTDGHGCILFAIFRGKVSEGVDFKDDEARCVVTVGIPHLPLFNPDVKVKRAYNDKRNAVDPKYLSGDSWYSCQAFRAVNQALGRCIRHKEDWGALVILDSRFSESKNYSKLSRWILDYRKCYSSHDEFEKSLTTFMNSKASATRRIHNLM